MINVYSLCGYKCRKIYRTLMMLYALPDADAIVKISAKVTRLALEIVQRLEIGAHDTEAGALRIVL